MWQGLPRRQPHASSPRRTIGVVGCDRAAGGEGVSERAGDPTGPMGAPAVHHPPTEDRTRLTIALHDEEILAIL